MTELSERDAIEIVKRTNTALYGVGITLEMRGKKRNLSIRGTFPPKPGSGNQKPTQTRISLEIRALTKADIKRAELIARQVGIDLNTGNFDWRKWSDWDDPTEPKEKTAGDWIEELERWWWDTHDRNPSAENNWRTSYRYTLQSLPKDEVLTKQLIINWITSNSPANGTRRTHYCRAGRALCKLAGIEIDLSEYDHVIARAINPREIPTDAELLAYRESIDEPGWKFLFGLQIAYGFRNHELLSIDFTNFPRLRVTRGKTGARTVTPVLQEWAIAWDLGNPVYPRNLTFSESHPLDRLGGKITAGYARRGLPSPYNVRHAFARRCLEQDLEPSLGAKLMGHSITTHTNIYRAWIEEDVYLDAVERKLKRD